MSQQNIPLRYRIGDTFTVAWPIVTNGEATPIEGRDIELWLRDASGRRTRVVDWTARNNVVYFTYQGKAQRCTGTYRLTLYENRGKENQHVIDKCNAFTLMPCSCETNANASTPAYFEQTEMMAGYRGESAYELAVRYGFVGTEEEWLASLQSEDVVARQMAQQAIDEVNESKTVVEILKENVENILNAEQPIVDSDHIQDGAVTYEKINPSDIATSEDINTITMN